MSMLEDTIHRLNLAKLEAADEEARKENADQLIAYYRGQHLALLEDYLDTLLSDTTLRATYKSLAAIRNVTRATIHKVAVIGSEPVAVQWDEPEVEEGAAEDEEGQPSTDQVAWDEWADAVNWPLFLQTVIRYTELLKTVIVHPYWDEDREAVRLRLLTPNLADVYRLPENRDVARPDYYVFADYLGAVEGMQYEVWDLVEGRTWVEDASGDLVGEIEDIPAAYEDPFVVFRRGYPLDSFWIEEGQEELLSVQRRVNYLLTASNVQVFYGHQFPVIEGARHEDEEPIMLDPSQVTFTGAHDGTPRHLQWIGPETKDVAEVIAAEIDTELDAVSESFDLPPGAMRATGSQARSGLSIELEHAPLRDKARRDRLIYLPTIRDLVQQIVRVWNAHGSGPKAEFRLHIPESRYASAEAAKVERDLELIDKGLLKPSEFVMERHPDMGEDDALEYLREVAEEKRELKTGSSFAIPPLAGNLQTDETTPPGAGEDDEE